MKVVLFSIPFPIFLVRIITSLYHILGNVRTLVWFVGGEYIITFRHFFLKNNYVVLVNSRPFPVF